MGTSWPRVVVCGPASWNHLITLDHLPHPVSHMQFATGSVHTVGGTSAGKALHLAHLGVDVELHALMGDDEDADRIAAALRAESLTLVRHVSAKTERHVNLMTERGERVSLYVSTPSGASPESLAQIGSQLQSADVAVIDLSELGVALLSSRGLPGGWDAPVWADLHDYDGSNEFHTPFLRSAEVVFMNDDNTDDPWELLRLCLAQGPTVAVCTLGAAGAIALHADGTRARVAAQPVEVVVDTNGAGDAFMAGYLRASLGGLGIADCLKVGAAQAAIALSSDHLHPSVGGVG